MILRPDECIDWLSAGFAPCFRDLRDRISHPSLAISIERVERWEQDVSIVCNQGQPIVVLLPGIKTCARRRLNGTPVVRNRNCPIVPLTKVGGYFTKPPQDCPVFCHARLDE